MAKKILIIDDSETVREMLAAGLLEEGYEVVTAASGEDGLVKAAAEKPDVIVLDTQMPGIDGFQTCKRLRENRELAACKIIMTTGQIEAVDAVMARRMGADDYCAKTGDISLCLDAVRKNL